MNLKSWGLCLFTALLSHGVLAQRTTDANLTGHVLDAETREHVPFVTVGIKGTTIGTVTDATGHYFIKNIPEGDYVLEASCMGYQPAEQKIRAERNRSIEVNFTLNREVMQLNDIVVTSSRNETDKKSSATIVNVVSPKMFERTASNNLSEVLNFQTGLRVEQSCQNCGVPQLRINGLEGQYSQILLDSRPIFSSLANVYGLEQLPAGMIERVEVIRGGGSALYGSNAIGGVVNIITREPIRNTFSLTNNTGFMTDGTPDVNTALNGSFVSDDYRAGVYVFGMIRNRKGYDRDDDGFTEIPKLKSETIGFRGYYKTSKYTKLTAEYHHIREYRRGGNLLDRPPHEADIAEELKHQIDGGGLQFDLLTRSGNGKLNLYSSVQHIDRDSYFGTDRNPDAYGHTNDLTAVAGGQYAQKIRRLLFLPAELTVGAEYSHNDLHDQMLGYDRDLKQTSTLIGGFIQNEWKNDKFSFLIGGRLDKHNKVENPIFSPRANLRYSPNDRIGLRASYSSGYRAPQAYEEDLHVAAVGGEVALISLAPDLKPERSNSISASADLYKAFGAVETNLLAEGFYTTLSDVFTLVEKGKDASGNLLLERQNAPGATVTGINLEGRIAWGEKVSLQMGYTWQRSRYKEPFAWSEDPSLAPQRKMLRTPDSYGYLSASWKPVKNLLASFSGTYTGRMLVPHYAGYTERDSEVTTPVFWDLGVRVAYDIPLVSELKLQLSAGVKNMLDSFQNDLDQGVKRDAKFIYGPALPRTVFFGVKFYL